MNIENFTLLEFFNQKKELIQEYTVALSYLKPKKTRCEIFEMKLKHVELIKNGLDSGDDRDLINIISKVQKIKKKEVLDMNIIDFFSLLASVRVQMEVIFKAEQNGLSDSKINLKWLAVEGSERMKKFGIYNTLDKLTNKKPHLYKVYMNMAYSEIFTILLKWKTEEELNNEMSKIKTKENV